jgi:hypothetical protein
MTRTSTAATAAALTATLGLAAASWVVAVRQMKGMDMGVASRLGSFASFVAMWVPNMLPGVAPAVLRHADGSGCTRAVLLFVGSYLAVWTLVGVAVYTLYRPRRSFAAGAIAIRQVSTSLRRSSSTSAGAGENVCSGFQVGL